MSSAQWPGLASFREEDQHRFFGREREITAIADLVGHESTVVFYGLSGLGKTSLLHAGLIPLLRRGDYLPVYVRLHFGDPEESLRLQISSAITVEAVRSQIEAPTARPEETLWEFFHKKDSEFWSSRHRLLTPVLIFDQFEETFTRGRERPTEIRELRNELAGLATGRPPAHVSRRIESNPDEARQYDFTRKPCTLVFSLREDFLAEFGTLSTMIPDILRNRVRLQRMSGEQALAAVMAGGSNAIDEKAAIEIVRFVGGQSDRTQPLEELEIEPAVLSVVCSELEWRRQQQGTTEIDTSILTDEKDILSHFYEAATRNVSADVLAFIEEYLVTSSGFRASIPLEVATRMPGGDLESLRHLVNQRVLRIEKRNEIASIELTHDLLLPVVMNARSRRRDSGARFEALAGRTQATRLETLVRWNRLLIALVIVLITALVFVIATR